MTGAESPAVVRPLSDYRNATPFPWMGGKSRMVKTITPLFPPHTSYVEPFGGAASILLAKDPAKVEVYNDMSGLLVNFFRVLQDPANRQSLLNRLEWTPYARMEYARALEHLDDADPVMQAWGFFVAQCQGISGTGSFGDRAATNWGYSIARDQQSYFRNHVEKLPAIAERLRQVSIEQDDGAKVIRRWDAMDTLFYVDPPYVESTRTAKNGRSGYHTEINDNDQTCLVDALLNTQGMVLLSGYRTPLYQPLEDAGWERREYAMDLAAAGRVKTFDAMSASGRTKRQRTECLWLSPRVVDWNTQHRQSSLAFADSATC
ncbi:MAG: DNA adenine methylase [Acidithiobacillus sp.]